MEMLELRLGRSRWVQWRTEYQALYLPISLQHALETRYLSMRIQALGILRKVLRIRF